MSKELKLNILLSVFIGLMIGMNVMGSKITTLFGVSVSVGIFMVPITFLITDIVAEVYGRKKAKEFLICGIIALVITFLYIALFISLSPAERYPNNEAYKVVFGSSLRFIIASIIAFAISQYHDIWSFEFWKKKTQGKFLWLRNNLSTMGSQAIDTFLFLMIAFYGAAPQFDLGFIWKLFWPFYIFKIVFAIIDTPFVYMGVNWLKGSSEDRDSLESVRELATEYSR